MKPTGVVYYDTTGDMIKSTLGVQKTKLVRSDVCGKTLTKQLTLIDTELAYTLIGNNNIVINNNILFILLSYNVSMMFNT